MTKKVLFITYDGLTDPLGQSQIIPYYIGLSKLGHQISILSCEKTTAFEKKGEFVKKLLTENNIHWSYKFYRKSPPILSTYFDLKDLNKEMHRLNNKQHFDIVHCRTILSALIGKSLMRKGVKLLFDIRGYWSEERVDGKLWSLKNPFYYLIYKLIKSKEQQLYIQSDHVITLTKNAKEDLIKRFNIKASKIDVVPCSVDLVHFSPQKEELEDKNQLERELGLEHSSPIICYAGSLGTRYMLDEMLNAFQVILKKYSKARFLFVTNSPSDEIIRLANEKDLTKYISITSTDYQSIPKYLQLADLALYFIYVGNSGKAVSPTKQAEFLSMGIPIITNDGIGDTSDIIHEEKVGFVVEDFHNFDPLIDHMEQLLRISKIHLIQVAKKRFDLSTGINTYHKVYQSL